jgi:hypothetical protein
MQPLTPIPMFAEFNVVLDYTGKPMSYNTTVVHVQHREFFSTLPSVEKLFMLDSIYCGADSLWFVRVATSTLVYYVLNSVLNWHPQANLLAICTAVFITWHNKFSTHFQAMKNVFMLDSK